jgi:F-type H+-transporting ATPase subunit delta
MPSHHEEQGSLARVYALALIHLAKEGGEEVRVAEELGQFASLLDSDPSIGEFLSSPGVDEVRRHDLLEKLLRGKASDVLVDALQVMNRNGRLGLVGAVERSYHELLEELQGRVDVIVRSAAGMTLAQQSRLRELVKRKTGKEADLISEVDPELIGGLVIQIGDRKLDATVARKLQQMSQAFFDRSSRELQRIHEYVATAES